MAQKREGANQRKQEWVKSLVLQVQGLLLFFWEVVNRGGMGRLYMRMKREDGSLGIKEMEYERGME